MKYYVKMKKPYRIWTSDGDKYFAQAAICRRGWLIDREIDWINYRITSNDNGKAADKVTTEATAKAVQFQKEYEAAQEIEKQIQNTNKFVNGILKFWRLM